MSRRTGRRRHRLLDPSARAHARRLCRAALVDHYEQALGSPSWSWLGDPRGANPDVLVWAPTSDRPHFTVATLGVSDRPMRLPPSCRDHGHSRRIELVLSLPPDWPLPTSIAELGTLSDPVAVPVHCLLHLADLPARTGEWLGPGHTVEALEPGRVYAGTRALSALGLWTPQLLDVARCPTPDGHVEVLGVVFLTDRELVAARGHGLEALLSLPSAAGLTERMDPHRRSVV
jgi:hypothetical protein